jgi:signal transduction histidine kinase
MLYKVLKNFVNVWLVILKRPQLQFALVLLLVFPLLFAFILQQFLSVANTQIEYTLKQLIVQNHDTIEALLVNDFELEQISKLLSSYSTSSDNIRTFQVARQDGDDLVIVASSKVGEAGTNVRDASWYQSAIAHAGNSVIYPFLRNNERVWLSYRAVLVGEKQWYIHSEINLAKVDNQLQRQVNRSLWALVIIFSFLGLFVWWVWRQNDYHLAWQKSEGKLQEQFGFTNMMVHELRAPLTAIRGYTSMVSEAGGITTEQLQYLERVSSSTSRMIRLVNDFLEVARIQAGTLAVKLEKVDIRATVNTVVEEMQTMAKVKNLQLTCTVPTEPVIWKTDVARLHQIITNLLSNAIKYTPEGNISVVLQAKSDGVEIRIQDSGHGISAKDQSQLFQPFKRVGNADAGAEVGSGLGMWITKQLVGLLNGDVSIESIQNVGTHAIIQLYKEKKK